MRFCVGAIFDKAMHNSADYTKRWYRPRPWETQLYHRLHVKHWKRHMPTYDNSLFDPQIHSWEEIVQATCQAELVHEVIAVFSLLPITFSIWFGAGMVFFLTSLLPALIDLAFAAIQRYNRPRLIRMIGRQALLSVLHPVTRPPRERKG